MDDEQKEQFSLPKLEEKILEFWDTNKIFEQSVERRKDGESFVFYEGPPTANGKPGIHHVEARSFKDVILRYKTMRGFFVPRRAGWDTHGLPVEIEVEKALGLKNKKDIEAYGIAGFNKKCRESVWQYKSLWEHMTARMGFWIDMSRAYVTYENNYIESLWWVIKQFATKGYLYEDYKVVPWCTRCGTALSSHELAQGYEKVTDDSVYIKFKIKNPEKIGLQGDVYILAWTTTPWTLPGNVALAVNPKIEYVGIKYDGPHMEPRTIENGEMKERSIFMPGIYLVAEDIFWKNLNANAGLPEIKALVNPSNDNLLNDIVLYANDRDGFLQKYKDTLTKMSGKNLVDLEYNPLYPNDAPYKIVAGDFVSTEDGTGVVHIAPAFGDDDFKIGKKNNLPVLVTTNERGLMDTHGYSWDGEFFKKANALITDDLIKRNILFKSEKHEHDYPFCWRCKTPLIYFARKTWWVGVNKVRPALLANNETINWYPDYLKHGRFGGWLKEEKDWAFSRERYWGTPLPVWRCDGCDSWDAVGSVEELRTRGITSKNRYIAIRHGEAESNVKNIVADSLNRDLSEVTENEKKQIAKTIDELKEKNITPDVILVSPFLRTHQTAEIVADAFKYKREDIVVDGRFGEINTGTFSGKNTSEYHSYFKSTIEKFTKAPPDGESLSDVKKRVLGTITELEGKYKNKTIFIVMHEYVAWSLWSSFYGKTNEEATAEHERRNHDFISTGGWEEMKYQNIPRDEFGILDLHKPYIDSVEIACATCSKPMKRVSEVVDVWFDSGAMPFAQVHYPFEFGEHPEISQLQYPADYIVEAVDQTRGWFYNLLSVGTLLGQKAPYRNVVSLGHVLDAKGKKMSKSLGNVVDPIALIEQYGADPVRWYFFTINQPWDSKAFSENDIKDASRRFFMILWNSFVFWNTYKSKKEHSWDGNAKLAINKWILSRISQLSEDVARKMDAYDVVGAARDIENFVVEDFSRWYIRRIRSVMRHESANSDETSSVLRFVLLEIAKMLAPFAPFISEELYLQLKGELKSVHWESFSDISAKHAIDQKLIDAMSVARQVVSIALEARAKAGVKVRQPLQKITIKDSKLVGDDESLKDIRNLMCEEINIKEVVFDTKQAEDIILDIAITPELKEEGMLRDIVREIQDQRKKSGLKPGDKVVMTIETSKERAQLIQKNIDALSADVGASNINISANDYSSTKYIFES